MKRLFLTVPCLSLLPIYDTAGGNTYVTREAHARLFAPRAFDLGIVGASCGVISDRQRKTITSVLFVDLVCGCRLVFSPTTGHADLDPCGPTHATPAIGAA